MMRSLYNLVTQTLNGFFTGLIFVIAVAVLLYHYRNNGEEWQGLPVIGELTDTYQEGLKALSYLGGTAVEHFYRTSFTNHPQLDVQSGETFASSKDLAQFASGERLVVQSSWDAEKILSKLKNQGFSKGKLKAAKKFTDYIDKHKALALYEMYESKILASTKLAQAILESKAGTSKLSTETNNQFGIKALPSSIARKKIKRKAYSELRNDEFIHRSPAISSYNFHDDNRYDRFEVYRTVGDSYNRHTQLLSQDCKMGRKGCYSWIWREFPVGTYCDISKAARVYEGSSHIAPEDFFDGHTKVPYYAACAAGLKMAGYATSPTYHKKIAYIIDTYELWRFDIDLIRSVSK